MANQFASGFSEFLKALTGLDSLTGPAVAAYLAIGLLTFLGSRRGPLTEFIAKRPALANFFGFLSAIGMNWNKFETTARAALTPKKK
jgi:hypothetical protein